MVSARPLPIFDCDTFRKMEAEMFIESIQGSIIEALLFLAIVGLTLLSTIDFMLHSIKQEKKADHER